MAPTKSTAAAKSKVPKVSRKRQYVNWKNRKHGLKGVVTAGCLEGLNPDAQAKLAAANGILAANPSLKSSDTGLFPVESAPDHFLPASYTIMKDANAIVKVLLAHPSDGQGRYKEAYIELLKPEFRELLLKENAVTNSRIILKDLEARAGIFAMHSLLRTTRFDSLVAKVETPGAAALSFNTKYLAKCQTLVSSEKARATRVLEQEEEHTPPKW